MIDNSILKKSPKFRLAQDAVSSSNFVVFVIIAVNTNLRSLLDHGCVASRQQVSDKLRSTEYSNIKCFDYDLINRSIMAFANIAARQLYHQFNAELQSGTPAFRVPANLHCMYTYNPGNRFGCPSCTHTNIFYTALFNQTMPNPADSLVGITLVAARPVQGSPTYEFHENDTLAKEDEFEALEQPVFNRCPCSNGGAIDVTTQPLVSREEWEEEWMPSPRCVK